MPSKKIFKMRGVRLVLIQSTVQRAAFMKKSQLSASQLHDLQLFHMILEVYGWEDKLETERLLDSGLNVSPEGVRSISQSGTYLETQFHAPVKMISLQISDLSSGERIQLHFFYDQAPERILEWIVSVKDDLSLSTYPELLKETKGRCEMILLQISDSELYEVKPPARI